MCTHVRGLTSAHAIAKRIILHFIFGQRGHQATHLQDTLPIVLGLATRQLESRMLFQETMSCYIAMCLCTGASSDEMQAHTDFRTMGMLATPAAYDHRRFTATWSELLDPNDEAVTKVKHIIRLWAKHVHDEMDNEDDVDARLAEGDKHFEPLFEEVRLAKRKAILATRVTPSNMNKRGLWGNVLSAFGFASSMYVSHEVASLDKRVIENHKELEVQRRITSELVGKFENFGSKLISKISDSRFFVQTGDMLIKLAHHYREVANGVLGLRMNKIRPSVISPIEAVQIAAELTTELGAQGNIPVHSGIDIVYRAEVSHYFTTDGFTIYLHVPIVRRDEDSFYKLYEAKSAVIVQDGVLLHLVPTRPYLAVHREGSLHIPLTTEQIDRCHQQSGVWVCTNQRTSTAFPSSCVACLWYQKTGCAATQCAHEWTTIPEDVYQITDQRFAVRESTTVIVSCNGNVTAVQVNDYFDLPLNCTAVAGQTTIQRGIEDQYSRESVTKTFVYPTTYLNVSSSYYKKIIPALEHIKVPPVKPLPQQVASLYHIMIIVGIVVASLVFLAGIAFIGYKIFKTVYRIKTPGEDVPAQPHQGVLEQVQAAAVAAVPLVV